MAEKNENMAGVMPELPDPSKMTEAEKKKEIKEHLERLKLLRATPRSDWHREFEDALQIDIDSWKNGSWVLREYTLGEDAPRIDFIVVSGDTLPPDVKEVFKLFRKKNVIEYKRPDDPVDRLVIRKVAAYVNFYIATAKESENVHEDNVTASIFTATKNAPLFEELEKEGIIIKTGTAGIYHVHKVSDLPFQIVITDELEGDGYAAYRALTSNASRNDVELLLKAFKDEKVQDIKERIHRILGLIETKNPGSVAEMIQEDKEMSSIFLDVLKPEIDDIRKKDLFEYVQDGGMSVEFASKKAGMSVEDFRREMEEKGYKEPQTA